MEKHSKDVFSKLNELTDGIRIAMLTTLSSEGSLHSRPMATQGKSEDGALWFFTYRDSAKVEEISREHQVNLAYVSDKDDCYVSVAGRATEVDTPATKEKFWNPMLKAWFPNGWEDPSVVLLRIEPTHIEYWDSKKSQMVQLFEIGKAILQNRSVDHQEMGDHGKFDLTG